MPVNNNRIDAVLDELALLQQDFIQKSGQLLELVEDDIWSSSYFLEELNVAPSDAKEMSLLTDGAFLLPSIMTLKRKIMTGIKLAIAKSDNSNHLREAIRKLGDSANYKLNRESR